MNLKEKVNRLLSEHSSDEILEEIFKLTGPKIHDTILKIMPIYQDEYEIGIADLDLCLLSLISVHGMQICIKRINEFNKFRIMGADI